MRVRRVGSLTCGVLLILFGVLCLAKIFFPVLNYQYIFRLWPLVLIVLGAEMLVANFQKKEERLVYDLGAIALTILLSCFAMMMGAIEYAMEVGTIMF